MNRDKYSPLEAATQTGHHGGPLNTIRISVALVMMLLSASALAGVRFQPRGCEFSVEFPGKPKIGDLYTPEIGKYETAQYEGGRGGPSDTYMCYAEGVAFQPGVGMVAHADPEFYLMGVTKSYTDAIGLSNVTYEYEDSANGPCMTTKGFKTVGGISAMYSDVVVLGEKSYIRLSVGCAARVFPQRGMSEFLNSVRRVTPYETATSSPAAPPSAPSIFSPTSGTVSLFEYSKTAMGSSRSIDPASVRVNGYAVEYDRYFTVKTRGGVVLVAQIQMDCRQRATRIVRINRLDDAGTKTYSEDFSDPYSPAAPGSDEARVADCMCAKGSPRPLAEAHKQLAKTFTRIMHTYGP